MYFSRATKVVKIQEIETKISIFIFNTFVLISICLKSLKFSWSVSIFEARTKAGK
jgi:hypothetical protein